MLRKTVPVDFVGRQRDGKGPPFARDASKCLLAKGERSFVAVILAEKL
jgi:hypothetical protein